MDRDRELVNKLCDLEIPSDIKISPNGEHVLYSTSLTWGHLKGKVPVTTLWLATFGKARSSRPITDGKCRDHSLAWHPSKDEFVFVSDRAGNATKSAIYTMTLTDLGEAIPVTSTENEQAIEKLKFSPDGKTIAFISKDEKTDEEKQREERQEDEQVWGQGYRYSRLRVIDLATKKVRTLSLDQHVLDFCWIFDKTKESEEPEITLVTCENTLIEQPYRFGTEIHVAKANLERSRKVCSLSHRPDDLSWGSMRSGDNEELYFRMGVPPHINFVGTVLCKLDVRKESCEPEKVAFENNSDIVMVQSADGHIIVRALYRLEDCLVWVGNKELYRCKQEIEAHDVTIGSIDGQVKLAIATSDVNHPMEVYSVGADGEEKIQLSQHGESFQGQDFGTCTILTCPTTDHHKIEIDGIYLEPTLESSGTSRTTPSKPHPTIVLLHGGPMARVANAFNTLYYMWTPYLLSLGYAILLPNYRGSTGRGEHFSSFTFGGVGIHDYADTIALTQHAVEKGYADPDRLVVGGYSHGGLITNLCALRNGDHRHGWKFKAAISGASESDIDSMALGSEMGIVYQAEIHNGAAPWTMGREDISTRTGGALWAFKEAMERSKKEGVLIIPPILLLHGANDERVPVSQSWGMQRALEHYSLPFEMVIYPRQGHMFHERYFWVDMALRVSRWVERYIGPGRRDAAKQIPVRKA